MSVYVYDDNNDLYKFYGVWQRYFPMLPRCGGRDGGGGRRILFDLSPGSSEVRPCQGVTAHFLPGHQARWKQQPQLALAPRYCIAGKRKCFITWTSFSLKRKLVMDSLFHHQKQLLGQQEQPTCQRKLFSASALNEAGHHQKGQPFHHHKRGDALHLSRLLMTLTHV